MEWYCVTCKKYTANEFSNARKTKQNRCSYQYVLFVARKSRRLQEIKNSAILMTSVKRIKPLTNFYWL